MAKNDKNKIWYERIGLILGLTIIIAGLGWILSIIFPVESSKNLLQRVGVSLSLFGFLAMLISGSEENTDNETGKRIWWINLHRINWIFIFGLVFMLLGFLLQFWGM